MKTLLAFNLLITLLFFGACIDTFSFKEEFYDFKAGNRKWVPTQLADSLFFEADSGQFMLLNLADGAKLDGIEEHMEGITKVRRRNCTYTYQDISEICRYTVNFYAYDDFDIMHIHFHYDGNWFWPHIWFEQNGPEIGGDNKRLQSHMVNSTTYYDVLKIQNSPVDENRKLTIYWAKGYGIIEFEVEEEQAWKLVK